MEIYPPTRQRVCLLQLLEAIDASPKSLRRDECGDWRINGRHGHIFAVPINCGTTAEGFQAVFMPANAAEPGSRA